MSNEMRDWQADEIQELKAELKALEKELDKKAAYNMKAAERIEELEAQLVKRDYENYLLNEDLTTERKQLAELREAIRQHEAARCDYDETYSDDDEQLWKALHEDDADFVDDSRELMDRDAVALAALLESSDE